MPPDDLPPPSTDQLESLFARLRDGKPSAPDELLQALYGQLKALARRALSGPRDSLDTTRLVHEVYLKLFRNGRGDWQDRAHFLGTAATAMRCVVIDHVRQRKAQKRAGQRVAIDDFVDRHQQNGGDLLALDEALLRLQERDPRLVKVIEMRFFAGYSVSDAARILGCSPRTVARDWQVARSWLLRELGDD